MQSSKLLLAIALLGAMTAGATTIDMNDPRRALGRDDDVRIDAQLHQDTVAPGSPVGVVYQVQNLTGKPVAVADRTADCSYDPETRTITLTIGSEIPVSGNLPHMAVIAPGEKKTFSASALLRVNLPSVRSPFISEPRYVQVKVNILRDLAPFATLLERQTKTPSSAIALTDAQFDEWLESNDAILLNTIPVRYSPRGRNNTTDAERRESAAGAF